jgi:hypothetical protein
VSSILLRVTEQRPSATSHGMKRFTAFLVGCCFVYLAGFAVLLALGYTRPAAIAKPAAPNP